MVPTMTFLFFRLNKSVFVLDTSFIFVNVAVRCLWVVCNGGGVGGALGVLKLHDWTLSSKQECES